MPCASSKKGVNLLIKVYDKVKIILSREITSQENSGMPPHKHNPNIHKITIMTKYHIAFNLTYLKHFKKSTDVRWRRSQDRISQGTG